MLPEKIAKMLLSILLTMVLVVCSASAAQKGPLLQEQFEDIPVLGQDLPPGLTGQGWTQSETNEALIQPLPLAGAVRGVISFDLQRVSELEKEIPETVFEFLDEDGKRVWRLQVQWETPFGASALLLKSAPAREYFQYGIRLWSPVIYLDRVVDPGQWVHLELFWDDAEGRFGAFADGQPLETTSVTLGIQSDGTPAPDMRTEENRLAQLRGEPAPFVEKPFQYFLDRVAAVAMGNNPVDSLPPGRQRTLLLNSVLDNFEVRTDILATIGSVTHDAFERAGYSGKLVAGDTFTVTLTSEPGGTASFDIFEAESELSASGKLPRLKVEGITMVEDPDSPGSYSGTHTVALGQYVQNGLVSGNFRNSKGYNAMPLTAARPVQIDGRVLLSVKASTDLVPADELSRAGLTVAATDANGKPVKEHDLKLTLSTTDEYTGTVGGGTFEDQVGGTVDVDWGGVTDSFGEVTAQYMSGFAAKTILVSAKDMVSGDVGVGWVRSYIDGTVDIVVTEPRASALSVAGSLDVSLSREWLTADGVSRSRITAIVKDSEGMALSGHKVQFTLLGENGSIRIIQGKTDARGRAIADYVAGTVMGQVQVEVRDLTSGLVAVVGIELRPDAPAEIELTADPGEVVIGDQSSIAAKVTDANGNPNRNVDVLYDVSVGEGTVSAKSVATDEKGNASVTFTAGDTAGLVTVRGTVISRAPTPEEISAAQGAVFLYGLSEDPGRLYVVEWMVKPGDEVAKGQDVVTLEDRAGTVYTVKAPRDGIVATFTAEEKDRVEYGDTLGYILPLAE